MTVVMLSEPQSLSFPFFTAYILKSPAQSEGDIAPGFSSWIPQIDGRPNKSKHSNPATMAFAQIASNIEKETVSTSESSDSMVRPILTKPTGTQRRNRKQSQGRKAEKKNERKIAHRYIERRRRSRLNDEFNTLRDLIPSCAGQVMQKLTILQVSNPF